MSGFLDNYEDVSARIRRLHATYPSNRVETSLVDFSAEKGFILVECRIYRHYEDEKPAGIDYAFGRVESYNVQMKRWFVEDTVTSAIGRCAGLVLGSETRPTLQNMQQVETMPKAFAEKEEVDLWATSISEDGFTTAGQAIKTIQSQLGGQLETQPPSCKHGHRVLIEGTGKTGKPYHGYKCTEKSRASQCDAIWYNLSSDGKTWTLQL
jgi:hypothetical protein